MVKHNLNKAVFNLRGLGKDASEMKGLSPKDKSGSDVHKKNGTAATDSPSSYLAPSMEIEGCIKAKGDIEIAGALKGDITSEGAVTVRFSVDGSISAKYLQLIDCTINGDITVSENVAVNEKSTVNGNITAKSVSCSGKVNGDISAEDTVALEPTAYIVGDITAAGLSVANGAVIKGKLSM